MDVSILYFGRERESLNFIFQKCALVFCCVCEGVRVLDPLELQSQTFVNFMWVLGSLNH